MRNLALCLAAGLSLSACGEFDAIRGQALDTGAQFNDEAVETSIIGLCRVYSIGSIERRFMRSEQDWLLWNQLCRPGREPLPAPDAAPMPIP